MVTNRVEFNVSSECVEERKILSVVGTGEREEVKSVSNRNEGGMCRKDEEEKRGEEDSLGSRDKESVCRKDEEEKRILMEVAIKKECGEGMKKNRTVWRVGVENSCDQRR